MIWCSLQPGRIVQLAWGRVKQYQLYCVCSSWLVLLAWVSPPVWGWQQEEGVRQSWPQSHSSPRPTSPSPQCGCTASVMQAVLWSDSSTAATASLLCSQLRLLKTDVHRDLNERLELSFLVQGERSWWLCRLPLLEYLDMRNLPCSGASPELQSGRTAGSGSCWAPNACNSWGRSQQHIQPTVLWGEQGGDKRDRMRPRVDSASCTRLRTAMRRGMRTCWRDRRETNRQLKLGADHPSHQTDL